MYGANENGSRFSGAEAFRVHRRIAPAKGFLASTFSRIPITQLRARSRPPRSGGDRGRALLRQARGRQAAGRGGPPYDIAERQQGSGEGMCRGGNQTNLVLQGSRAGLGEPRGAGHLRGERDDGDSWG